MFMFLEHSYLHCCAKMLMILYLPMRCLFHWQLMVTENTLKLDYDLAGVIFVDPNFLID